ncbi:MAG: caspase family protein [Spirochaetaceae bacterium]|nr:caspase family protein [Spirochaetaceae bacterium]
MKSMPGKRLPLSALSLVILALFFALASSCSRGQLSTAHYYLCIGIANYPAGSLDYPAADAESMSQLLADEGWQAPPGAGSEGGVLLNEKATKSAIAHAVQTFFAGAETDSTVLVYFSGHGAYDASTGSSCLVPYDFNGDSSDGITPEEMYDWFEDIPTKNIIFISDSCYSGNFVYCTDSSDTIPSSYVDSTGNTIFTLPYYVLSNFGSLMAKNAAADGKPAPIAISAAGATEEAYDGDPSQGHGVFTYYLLQAAESGDSNGDGFVSCTEAYTYIAGCIEDYWNAENEGDDTMFYPHISDGMRDLVLFM